ncbi:MAG: extracellular solute-binding protein [Desulfobacterales bacterium]
MKKVFVISLLIALVSVFSFSNLYAAEELSLLTWKGYAPQPLVEKFEKETGITVKITYSNNEEMIAKLRATRGAGFDLAQPSQDRISSVQEKFNIYWGTSGLVVNNKFAPTASDYSDLLNAMYKGRISYRLKRPTLIAIAFAMGENPFARYSDPMAYQALMDRVGQALIDAKPFVKNYWTNGDALLESMRSGEVYLAMAWDGAGWKLHGENPNIDFRAPRSGALGWIDTFAIPAKAKNLNAAYAWINFMLKPENAAFFTNDQKYGTASSGTNAYLEASVRDNFERCFPPKAIANIKWYPPVPAKLEEIEGLILDKVKAAQ